MSYLHDIFERLQSLGSEPALAEMHGGKPVETPARELLARVAQARGALRAVPVKPGDRVVLLAGNSVLRIAADLAIMAEAAIVVPMYARQAASELAEMMRDCAPVLVVCGDDALRTAIQSAMGADAPRCITLADIFAEAAPKAAAEELAPREDSAPATIIYTSGTSGVAKGVVLSAANITYMLGCTAQRLDVLMRIRKRRDRVFHYLPLNFAGSWILMLTCLKRGSQLILCMDLTRLAQDMPKAESDYFLNVPQLLERLRKGVDEQMEKRGSLALRAYARGREAWLRQKARQGSIADFLWVNLTQLAVFPMIRRTLFSNNLRALICGSAPLSEDTQLYFEMLGVPVLQVYGLTETTAICTMDDPEGMGRKVVPGRVGPAIEGCEMKLGENDEILVRGPNIFSCYWNRPEETAKVLETREDGVWFHSGDQGEVDHRGNWKISGRLKNLIVMGGGHNVAPEPIEDKLLAALPGAQQAVLVGNGKSYLSVLVTGEVADAAVERAIAAVNAEMPHYRQIRRFHRVAEPFSIEAGLLTANGKLKRDAIYARYASQIEAMYAEKVTA